MADKLVRLSDAIKAVENQCTDGNMWGNENLTLIDASKTIDELSDIPAVDAVEMRHGHWVTEEEAIEKDDYSLRDTCSACGHCDWDCTESQNFNYCPNCGAKMDDVYQPPICGPGEEDGDGNTDPM